MILARLGEVIRKFSIIGALKLGHENRIAIDLRGWHSTEIGIPGEIVWDWSTSNTLVWDSIGSERYGGGYVAC